jgi:L,D-transpeptidase ErfK/SrfK
MIRTPFASFFLAVVCLLLLLPDRAGAATYTIVGDLAGAVTEYTVKEKDTLYKIARQHDIGIVEIMTANPGIDPWVPTVGAILTIPTAYVLPTVERKGIVIDLSSLRLFYFPENDKNTVMTFPLGIGMDGWATPVGVTKITLKREHPTWIAPESIIKEDPDLPRVVLPGPDNPLGDYAMNLGMPGYRIHGTNKPYGIGRRSSHGCMRMYPEDIETLFKMVGVGTQVTIMESQYKIGWSEGTLYLQTTPSQEQADEIFEREELTLMDIPGMYGNLSAMAGESADDIDWDAVRMAALWRSGIPIAITTREVASAPQQEFAPVR